MSGEGETNNNDNDDTSISIDNDKDQTPKKKEEEKTPQDDSNNFLLSHIQPPSHILSDGRFINLPPPSAIERSSFFERAVASHNLIVGDEKIKKKSGSSKKRSSDDDINDDASTTTSTSIVNGSKRRKKTSKNDAPYVHPLAIASARLRAKGMDELSKSINLGGLVIGGEYFGLSNIVNQRMLTSNGSGGAANTDTSSVGDEEKAKDAQSTAATATATATNDNGMSINESIILTDQRLRSNYVLQTRQSQYTNASTVLSRHTKRLCSSISAMRIIDDRLLKLRKQWRLVAPEHGTRTFGPVRPKEVVAVDVEVYDRDRLGGGGSGGTGSTSSSLGRIARRVPRFATLELDDEYNISRDVKSLRKKVKDVMVDLKKVNDDDDDDDEQESSSAAEIMEVEKQEASTSSSNTTTQPIKTKAEPFAIADPTLGKIDVDFDPDKVPLLTLLFEIEKPSTGFVECATLSSSFLSSSAGKADNNDSNVQEDDEKRHLLHPDERVIEALQHSLFCASLFESMRAEIIPTSSTQTNIVASQLQQQRHKSVAWLSSEMEESFLPPPFSMAGEDAANQTGDDSQLLCVIHCHEGELKIQLDDEYSLTVKLVEAGTAAEAGTRRSSDSEEGNTVKQSTAADSSAIERTSGSQSPAQLRILCRALLLRSQTLYHEHCMKTKMGNNNSSALQKKEEEKPPMGFARIKKEVKLQSPHILQKCVGLGCKFILEKKVRLVLRVSCFLLSHSLSFLLHIVVYSLVT